MNVTSLTKKTVKVHQRKGKFIHFYLSKEFSSNNFYDFTVKRRSKVSEKTARRSVFRNLVKINVRHLTLMRDSVLMSTTGMIQCLEHNKEELEVHLKRNSILTKTMIKDIQKAVVEAATDNQVIVDKLIEDKEETTEGQVEMIEGKMDTTRDLMSTNVEAPQSSLKDLETHLSTTTVEVLLQCTAEMDLNLDHHHGMSQDIHQVEEV